MNGLRAAFKGSFTGPIKGLLACTKTSCVSIGALQGVRCFAMLPL